MDADGKYTKLNVEGYGGMLCAPWFDRPSLLQEESQSAQRMALRPVW